jgi:uncharacterized membrane protein
MKTLFQFFKTTILGGLCVLSPIAACAYLMVEIVKVAMNIMDEAVQHLPVERLGGTAMVPLLAVGFVLALSFLLGLIVRTTIGRNLGGWMERSLLRLIPGYDIFKTLAVQLAGRKDETRGSPVLVRMGASRQVGFLMEENPTGELTVFVPASPVLSLGAIHIVEADRVERVNASMVQVVNCLTGMGIGSSPLTRGLSSVEGSRGDGKG